MTTTPLDSDGIMKVLYTTFDTQHAINYRINFSGSPTPGVNPMLAAHSAGSADELAGAFWDQMKLKLKTLIRAADSLDGFEIWDMQTAPPTWIYAHSETVVGTGTDTNAQQAKGVTIVFLDEIGKRVKHVIIGCCYGNTSHNLSPTGSFVETYVTDMLNITSGHMGDYISGRSAHPMLLFKSYTVQTFNAVETKHLWG